MARNAARQLQAGQQANKMTSLRNQRTSWRDSTAEYRKTQRQVHIRLLQEGDLGSLLFAHNSGSCTSGAGLCYEKRRSELAVNFHNVSEEMVNTTIMADLQQLQDQEFDAVLSYAVDKVKTQCSLSSRDVTQGEAELEQVKRSERASRVEEHLDGVARILLGAVEVQDRSPSDLISLVKQIINLYPAYKHYFIRSTRRRSRLSLFWKKNTTHCATFCCCTRCDKNMQPPGIGLTA